MKPRYTRATTAADTSRRTSLFSAAAALGVPAALAIAGKTAQAQSTSNESAQLIRVGPGRTLNSIQKAFDSIIDASASKPYTVMLDPGVYDLVQSGRPVQLKSHVCLAGTDQQSTVVIVGALNNIRAVSFSRIERLTIISSGHSPSRGAIEMSIADLTNFCIDGVYIALTGGGNALVGIGWVARAEVRNCTIVTTSVGIAIRGGGHVYVHDTNIHLIGQGGEHVGILARNYCRIYVFGGKIGTGYGYPPVTNTLEPVVGVRFEANGSGRIVLHGVWSICRNDGAPADVPVNCVRVEGASGWVRVFGCYLQAENPTLPAGAETIANPGMGRVELYGSRTRNYGTGPVYGGQQIGRRLYTVADNNVALDGDMGGLGLLDARNGNFRVQLPWLPHETGQFLFKKIDTTGNTITIDGNGRLIDGQPQTFLATPYQVLSLRFVTDQYLIMP